MLKTAIITSAFIFGAAAPATPHLAAADPVTAEQTVLNLPNADKVIAQFSYLEVSHSPDGFELAVTDSTAIFVDFEFPGDLHIRIGI